MDKVTIGKRIREQRKKMNLTLEKFAEMSGIGLVYLGEIERGGKMPSINTFIKMVNAFDISADILLRDEVTAAKPYVLNEITERMKDLTPPQMKMIKDVMYAMLDNMTNTYKTEDEI
jgi:transcriptional regulator with XRE-family HTH domain